MCVLTIYFIFGRNDECAASIVSYVSSLGMNIKKKLVCMQRLYITC